jgi:ribosomal protein L25 (general stress protein Ctc)
MKTKALLKPETVETSRTQLRQRQSSVLRKAKGRTVVVVRAREEEDEKCVVDKRYFEEILQNFGAALETLEIATDTKLFSRLLKAAETVDEEIRLGKLHSFEEAFGEG